MYRRRTQSYGTVHAAVSTCTCAQSQVRALCHVRRTSYVGIQHAQRVVVKGNTCTEDTCMCTIHRVGTSNQGLYKHAQQQCNKWNKMHLHVTMFVSVCTIITRQVYCMTHTYLRVSTVWYVQVYCVFGYGRICHCDDVQVHVCNNASVCTSVSQHERMHAHVL